MNSKNLPYEFPFGLLLFEHLTDEAAQITYVQRIWQVFRPLFATSFSKAFDLFEIEEEFQSYFYAIEQAVVDFLPALECET
ncbi:MAG: hypothetical protein ABIL06_06860 [Pseudomonadota bacterium]